MLRETVLRLHHGYEALPRPARRLRWRIFLVGHTGVFLPILTGWLAWDRARPRVIADGIADPGGILRAFPSGHLVQAAFAYGLLLWLWWRATPSRLERAVIVVLYLALALVVSGSRLRLGAHWPSDVVAGFVLGAAWLAVVVRAYPREATDRGTGAS